MHEDGAGASVTGVLRAGATVDAAGGVIGTAAVRGVGGAGAGGAYFVSGATGSFVTEALTLVATGRFFEVFVCAGEVVANPDALDEKGVGCYRCG